MADGQWPAKLAVEVCREEGETVGGGTGEAERANATPQSVGFETALETGRWKSSPLSLTEQAL